MMGNLTFNAIDHVELDPVDASQAGDGSGGRATRVGAVGPVPTL